MAFIEMDFASGGGGSLSTFATLEIQTAEEDLKGKGVDITFESSPSTYIITPTTFGTSKDGSVYKTQPIKVQSIGRYSATCDGYKSESKEVTDFGTTQNISISKMFHVDLSTLTMTDSRTTTYTYNYDSTTDTLTFSTYGKPASGYQTHTATLSGLSAYSGRTLHFSCNASIGSSFESVAVCKPKFYTSSGSYTLTSWGDFDFDLSIPSGVNTISIDYQTASSGYTDGTNIVFKSITYV